MSWLIALFARLALLVVWLSTPLVHRAFHGGWILPLLGILILPITTLTYVLVYYISGSVTGWGWLWVALALLLDLAASSFVTNAITTKLADAVCLVDFIVFATGLCYLIRQVRLDYGWLAELVF